MKEGGDAAGAQGLGTPKKVGCKVGLLRKSWCLGGDAAATREYP